MRIIPAIISLILLLVGCGKSEVIDTPLEPHTYTVRYFANGDSIYVWADTDKGSISRYASKYDTTFKAVGGWTMSFMVKFYEYKSQPTMCGVVVDGDTVDGCIGGDHCIMGMYLPLIYKPQ